MRSGLYALREVLARNPIVVAIESILGVAVVPRLRVLLTREVRAVLVAASAVITTGSSHETDQYDRRAMPDALHLHALPFKGAWPASVS
jgi:hypothetical protein